MYTVRKFYIASIDDIGGMGFGTIVESNTDLYDINKEITTLPVVQTPLTKEAQQITNDIVKNTSVDVNKSTNGILGTVSSWLFGKDANGNTNGVASIMGTVRTDNAVHVDAGLSKDTLWWILLFLAAIFGLGWLFSSRKKRK